jgi:uncharacterized lipoprotein YajG
MKTFIATIMVALASVVLFTGCEKKQEPTPPATPEAPDAPKAP